MVGIYYSQNREQIIKYNKKRYWDNHKEKLQYQKDRYYKKRKQLIDYQKQYNQDNKNKHNKTSLKYNKLNYHTNIHFKILYNSRIRIWEALNKTKKSKRTLELVGCSLDELKQHLEKQFKIGMDWNNYGAWHIDHIQPCASFDLSKPEEQNKCFHYTNLQPLWAKENMSKGGK